MSYYVNHGHMKLAVLGAAVAVALCTEGLRLLFRNLLKLDAICV